ncbi:MAG: endo alpha-1,4 polygalactosaminidase [Chloroflexota bacterium]
MQLIWRIAVLAALATASPMFRRIRGRTGVWWQPWPGTSWQIQYTGKLNLRFKVEVYNLDLFDITPEVVDQLHAEGRKVICAFNAGAYEDWRPDADQFPRSAIGQPVGDWEGEWWADIRKQAVRDIMLRRLDLAVSKGCDAVDPWNVDGYAHDTGFPLTAKGQRNYNRLLAEEAHRRGLAIALHNDVRQIAELEPSFDFAVNEECFRLGECDLLTQFIEHGKPVFQIEYGPPEMRFRICPRANARDFDTLIKNWELDAQRTSCR